MGARIEYERMMLSNGLTLIVHPDKGTPMSVVNILYKVGARDEDPARTGFAHLFEHLMFEGSVNISDFDTPIERAGGNNNAFTNNDFTNYYDMVPAQNLETLFWLESDRMLQLDFSQNALDLQKKVVSEEFKENYLNQPYGNVWHKLRDMAYKKHPYRWPTIGKDLSHIEDASLENVESFFQRFYHPANAVLVVAGNVDTQAVAEMAEKWFGSIPAGESHVKDYPKEDKQIQARTLLLEEDVPYDKIFRAYHMCDRHDPDYYATDLLTDLLSNGPSSRLIDTLVREDPIFTQLDAYISSDVDEGLLIISGMLREDVSFEKAQKALDHELQKLIDSPVPERELQKVKNIVESTNAFENTKLLSRAISLAYSEMLGDVELVNQEEAYYEAITAKQIQNVAASVLRPENCSTLFYKS